MIEFFYKARNSNGGLVEGQIQAIDPKEARIKISAQGLIPVKISTKSDSLGLEKFGQAIADLFKGASLEEMLVFNRQIQTVYTVGIPILTGLRMIRDQTENKFLKKVIGDIALDVEQGMTLHDSMSKHPKVFDQIYLSLIKSGESSGKLDEILDLICYFTEQRAEQVARMKSATFYPKIVLVVISTVLLSVVYFIIPRIKDFYSKFGADLPMITQIVVMISNFCVDYWYLLFGIIAGSIYGFKKIISTPKGKDYYDAMILKIPVFGNLMLQMDVLTLSTVLEMLVRSGLPLVYSFDIVQGSVSNGLLRQDLARCKEALERGEQIQDTLSKSKVLPKMFVNFVSVGAEGGKIEHALTKIAAYYKIQVEYKMSNFSKAIEPILLAFIFGIVLVVALAVFMPLWSMSGLIRKGK